MTAPVPSPVSPRPAAAAASPSSPYVRAAKRVLLHLVFLLVAVGCFAGWAHYRVVGNGTASLACLIAAALFGFMPVRDVMRVFFAVEGKALHLAHGLGGLAIVLLPLAGVVSGTRVLSHAALAPFAIMGAAQAVMHQDHPRNAQQAAALQRFASSLPELGQFAGLDLSKPQNAAKAIAVLTDIVGKAQALGETELQSDPGFQSALAQVSTRLGGNLGLDAADALLAKMAQDPATAAAVPALRREIAQARHTLSGPGR